MRVLDELLPPLWRRHVYRAPNECEHCPACSSARLSDLAVRPLHGAIDGRRVGLVTGCRECGLVFVNPVPHDDQLATFYSPEGKWGLDRHAAARERPKPASRRHGAASWSRMFDTVRHEIEVTNPPPGSRVLDFGCGDGKFLDVLQDCGWETFGIEPAVHVAFARHARLPAIPAEPTFDLIVLSHVLEHVTKPLVLLTALCGAAMPGAHLFISVPSLDNVAQHQDLDYVINGRAHVTAYTRACLEQLLARSGWEPLGPPAEQIPRKSRMLARRARRPVRVCARPLGAAHRALLAYKSHIRDGQPLTRGQIHWPSRGLIRWSARRLDRQLRMQVQARKAAARQARPEATS